MGINFKQTTKGKVGDIIYPAYNGTNGFWVKDRWDLVMEANKDGYIIDTRSIYDFATVKAIELMEELEKIKDKK